MLCSYWCVFNPLPYDASDAASENMVAVGKVTLPSNGVAVPSGYALMPFSLSSDPCTTAKLKVCADGKDWLAHFNEVF
jgi:hypothetical protein